ncbi:DUF397 domain-containing protein [Streptomyces sp. NPDC054841]
MTAPTTTWRRSSYSNGMGGECVEVAVDAAPVLVRDSKRPFGPRLRFEETSWSRFLGFLHDGAPNSNPA